MNTKQLLFWFALFLAGGVAAFWFQRAAQQPDQPAPVAKESAAEGAASAVEGKASNQPAKAASPPLSPEQALATFRIDPGLRVELVAAEPEVESPVAMSFDEDGRLWVAEYRDYPHHPEAGNPPEGRIRVLEDRDGDGRYETSTIFADQLLFANGLMPWRGGVIVTGASAIVYLKDTDGDGRADRRELLYEGFNAKNPQHYVNTPVLGIDNWVYVANGISGEQKVKRSGQGEAKVVSLRGMDFRFDLIGDRYEAISGMGQYGNTFDDWGQRFICQNHHHIWHVVLPNRYLQRNPFLASPGFLQDVSELEFGPLSSGGKVYPLSRNWTTSSLHAGRFTSACGTFIYRGTLLPAPYRGAAFTCEPAGNLVHQEILRPEGATFRSRPARAGVEFLATADDWFRPVFLTQGPDGALYVVDMYRAVIDHPDFLPPELKNRPDLRAGKERGRIWRVVPEDALGALTQPRSPFRRQLSKATTPALVQLLEHPDAWWRTTAQRLLWERQDRSCVEPLRNLLAASEQLLARLHAAWLLEGFASLDSEQVLRLLQDKHPRLRENALRLCERWLSQSESIQQAVRSLAADPDPQVRFQTALSLGEWDDDRILPPLARIALAGVDDRWTRAAVSSSVPHRAGALVVALLKPLQDSTRSPPESRLLLLRELATLVGARRDPAEVSTVLEALLAQEGPEGVPWQLAGLLGVADGLGRRGGQLAMFVQALPGQKWSKRIDVILARAGTVAADAKAETSRRLEAVRLLAHASWASAEPVLTRLLKEEPAQEVRLAVVRALAAQARPEIAEILTQPWKSYSPAVRREATEALLQRPERALFLLGEVEAGRIKPADVDPVPTRQLVNHSRADIRERAGRLLKENLPEERKQVLERYQAALTIAGNAESGRGVFQKNCATCHQVAGIGVQIGPALEDYHRTKTKEQLLADILNPNQAVDGNYVNYSVSTKSGRALTGMLAAETASSITLRRAENQTDVVLRADIEEIQSTGVSLMPEGLEKNIGVAEMADLIAFLKNWRYLSGEVPLGGPPAVRQGKDVP